MNNFRRIIVQSFVPEELQELKKFSYNLWWSWKPSAQKLFQTLGEDLWYEVEHNPLKLLKYLSQNQLNKKANDPEFLTMLKLVMDEFTQYMTRKDTWFDTNFPEKKDFLVAYFCAEFGIHESVPVYSGGLGMLAGDHCKSASDLGIPLVGVGMMYKQGYFNQRIDSDGNQENMYPSYDFGEIPIELMCDDMGNPYKIYIVLPGRKVYSQIWRMQAGRSSIFLLDTDIQENLPEDRILTSQLYGGDHEMRITQELLLGIGGTRALRVLGYKPSVWHMNEGHSAFMVLERVRELVEKGIDFDIAKEIVSSDSIFTTHTPLPAGNDAFDEGLMHKYFDHYFQSYGLDWDRFFMLGRDANRNFSMTILAMKMSKSCNGVSKLHGEVSRKIWSDVWKDVPLCEIPITHVTNGVHTETWVSREFRKLYNEYLGDDWILKIDDPDIWKNVHDIPAGTLWDVHKIRKQRLVDIVKQRIRARDERNGIPQYITDRALENLTTDALFVGFARRFATYKRATLLFKDIERLKKIVSNREKPVAFFFAGKAHPADRPGQSLIKEIYHLSMSEPFLGKIFILENYNMTLARYLVSGVDVWLNNPRRPREASGTSGQKVAINGGINFSVLDGWWVEGYNGKNGWTIGELKEYANNDIQDQEDSASLYYTLENAIIPEFFERSNGENYSEAWIRRMKESIHTVTPHFSTHRMVKDYLKNLYLPAFEHKEFLVQNNHEKAIALVQWKKKVLEAWKDVWVTEINPIEEFINTLHVQITCDVMLDGLSPDDVKVEVYLVREYQETQPPVSIVELKVKNKNTEGRHIYTGVVEIPKAGTYSYSIRVRPWHKDLLNPFEMGIIRWMQLVS
ncbi:MAG: alpha-glucan family phosphorylase [Candidatus Marinimicrobia bacterium]|nr:alpha-glucan family phosphorylase [Candidatus Neomarinimicrobiota bacterium]MDD5583051.1 alpha-glucan family phosphorylase [Candidatus Neomarinimicrobiota bacterium]